jgi:DNA-binding transcriptional LysR family regulator
MRTRTLALIALGAIVTSVAVGFIIHLLLGLLVLRIAVGPSAVTGRQAALALAQVFSADHPRVRVRTVVMPDLLAAARALDNEDVDLAIARSEVW